MEIKIYKTLWGMTGELIDIFSAAPAAGFDGIEGAAPVDKAARTVFADALRENNLDFIAEICTAGGYVPDRRATPLQHLQSLQKKIALSAELQPRFITCLAGCDAWPEFEQLKFFEQALRIAERESVIISFETHRSRSLFNPWITARIADYFPEMKFTCDFSHWCVVCERLLDAELDGVDHIARQAHHIHARVGYAQGPQVPHPAAPEYAECLVAHRGWWEAIWQSQRERGYVSTTMTAEFGPDGYLQQLPFSAQPVADLEQINAWMAVQERAHYRAWHRK